MNVLILGGGGREHALGQAIAKSPKLDRLFFLPGNSGTANLGMNLPGSLDDLDYLAGVARDKKIDLTIVGPEAPLCAGIVDVFEAAGLRIFGPSKAAARIEGDKAFAKELMRRAVVPTAEARIFERHDAARTYVATRDSALVVKAAGLAAGKGVIVCAEPSEALLALERVMLEKEFGDAGKVVIVEERLVGPEISVLALVDGNTIYTLETAQDYKRLNDGDTGPNTGGMGAVSPALHVNDEMLAQIERDIFVPIIDALRSEGVSYRGVLYAGIMVTHAGPKVLEFNCRFGDPETQAVLPRLQSDLLEALDATVSGKLDEITLQWDPRPAVCVVMAAGGYPGEYARNVPIMGLKEAESVPDVSVFHAGMAETANQVVTAGGRVLAVTALGPSVAAARGRAYEAVATLSFKGAHYRQDIAAGSAAVMIESR
jgi:phosphoribosylamine--glycine ligase